MTPKSITLQHIYDLQLDTAEKVGRIGSLEMEVRYISSAVSEQGKAVAAMQQVCSTRGDHCNKRFSRISRDLHGVTETTGVVQLDHMVSRRTLKTLIKIGSGVIAVATVIAAFMAGQCNESTQAPKVIQIPVPVPAKVGKPSARLMDIDEGVKDLQSRLPRMDWFNIGVKPVRKVRQ